ncbi:MAG: methionine--tRNA ligase [Legionellales bacterium]|nr:methionine--tRNA ligase [Legionellales bacterium]
MEKLVTTALPYANGPIHLGHLVEHVQADIWVRFQRLIGRQCLFLCGDDAHGSAIMLAAEKSGIQPEQWIKTIRQEHYRDFQDFLVDYDLYHTTHSDENKQLSCEIYKTLRDSGLIERKRVTQAYDDQANMFLPDRYVKGTCPKCGSEDQYGDSCEQCGAVYTPDQLLNPKSVLTQTTPIYKDSEHYFFALSKCQDLLEDWVGRGALQPEVEKKLSEWFDHGLKNWDISRDAPYFGIEIPDAPGKYFYVWMDAPIGYIAATKHWANSRGLDEKKMWSHDSKTDIVHFIGKDILYFHGLFWPAILHHAGYKTPDHIYAHGFLTINGKKMSKSRGTYVTARAYLDAFDPDYLRYYFAAKLSPTISDIDLNWTEFASRINAELIGKIINIGSRCTCFIHRYFSGVLSDHLSDEALYQQIISNESTLLQLYDSRDYNQCLRLLLQMADQVNQYLDQVKPWAMVKDESVLDQVGPICTLGVSVFYSLMGFLSPVLPGTFERVQSFLRVEHSNWSDFCRPLLSQQIDVFPRLLERVKLSDASFIDE